MTQLPAVTGYKKVPLIHPPRRSKSALTLEKRLTEGFVMTRISVPLGKKVGKKVLGNQKVVAVLSL